MNPLIFFGCKIFDALQQNEKFQVLKKFLCFSVLLALAFLIFVVSGGKKKYA